MITLRKKLRGVSLVELLLALAIISIISVAMTAMLAGAARTDRFVLTASQAQSQADFALRRILHNVRMCSSLTGLTTSDLTTFSLVTQTDDNNNQASYAVTYTLVTLPSGIKELRETDSRTGTTVLISDVTTFTARLQNSGSPTLVILNLTTGGPYPVTRSLKIAPRNL